jgi:hypothetical protein
VCRLEKIEMDRRVASADFSGTDSTVGLLQNWNAGNTAGL